MLLSSAKYLTLLVLSTVPFPDSTYGVKCYLEKLVRQRSIRDAWRKEKKKIFILFIIDAYVKANGKSVRAKWFDSASITSIGISMIL